MKKLIPVLLLVALAWSLVSHADDFDEDSAHGYEYIVNSLTSPSARTLTHNNSDPFALVKIHLGVSFVSSYLTVEPSDRKNIGGFHHGMEANFGIDLFNPAWIAEGIVRSFGSQKIDDEQVSLKEFELRIVRRYFVRNNLFFRFGVGLSARYLDMNRVVMTEPSVVVPSDGNPAPAATSSEVRERYTTPASVFATGFEVSLTESVGLGLEMSYRSTMIDDTVDRHSLDAGLKIAGHF